MANGWRARWSRRWGDDANAVGQARVTKRAVVIGAGMAGLTAARALAAHFQQVTVLERDRLVDAAQQRPGTPQAQHVHGLLAGGLNALADLLPGFEGDLVRAGAVPLRGGLDIRVERPGFDPFAMRDLGVLTYALSRPAIAFIVRRRVLQQANVRLQAGSRVTQIVASADGASVVGVHCEGADGRVGMLPADLVVDASGRGVPKLKLLQSLGRARSSSALP